MVQSEIIKVAAGQPISGSCMCGAISVTAELGDPALRACHCEMCRKQTSSVFMTVQVDQDSIRIDGPLQIYRSSEWAQRGFCKICGSTIFYNTVADGARNLAAGLFPRAGDAPMKFEFYVDNCPAAYALRGTHKKLTTQETIDLFAPSTGDDT